MTWIKTIQPFPLTEESAPVMRAMKSAVKAMPADYRTSDKSNLPAAIAADSIVLSLSLIPGAMLHTFASLGVLFQADLPLSRREQELIATVVSAANGCSYSVHEHAEVLRQLTGDSRLADMTLAGSWRNAGVTDRENTILDYAEKLTTAPARIQAADIDALRAAGFDDIGVLQINLIASWFNYINRVADGLGVGRG